ncbi:hypothetical protein ACJRO7_032239 [Eucalyptus globulus]|uniref:Uncharacterized protein n=1 Tax=Eucalyptus globulus TaxID=34317 RepID=A0ABD3JQ21_EUCGL
MRRRRGGSRRLSLRIGLAGGGQDADGDGGVRRQSSKAFLKRPLRLSEYAAIPSAEDIISDYFRGGGGGGDGDGDGDGDVVRPIGLAEWVGLHRG